MSRDVGYLPRCADDEPRRILVTGEGESESDRTGEGEEGLVDAENRLELAMTVTGRIEQLRLTRRELEKRSGVSVSTIRQIEHPKGTRNFGRKVLEAISEGLEWPPGHLVRVAYRSTPETPDPIVQAMMVALAPYLEKIDAIPRLQADVAAIKADLGISVDSIHDVSDSVDSNRRPDQGSDERRDAQRLTERPELGGVRQLPSALGLHTGADGFNGHLA
jgi:transcriptional regulator with XRE-family HTH domain